jgi:hypothetical protein
MNKGTEGIFARDEPFEERCAEGKRSRLAPIHAPHPLRGVGPPISAPFGGNRGVACEAPWDPEAAYCGLGCCGLRRIPDRLRDGAEQGGHPM